MAYTSSDSIPYGSAILYTSFQNQPLTQNPKTLKTLIDNSSVRDFGVETFISPLKGFDSTSGWVKGISYNYETHGENGDWFIETSLTMSGPYQNGRHGRGNGWGDDDDDDDDGSDWGDDDDDDDDDGNGWGDDDDDDDDEEENGIIVVKTVSNDSVTTGSIVTYTVSLTNNHGNSGCGHGHHHNDGIRTVDTIIDDLPYPFTYITGSVGGFINSDPDINGNQLSWDGYWSLNAGQTLTFTFDVQVGFTRGMYENSVTVWDTENYSFPTGFTAPVQVFGPQLQLSKSVDRSNATPGDTLTYTVYYTNVGDDIATYVFSFLISRTILM